MGRVLKWIAVGILLFWLITMALCAFLGWLVGRAHAAPICQERAVVILMDQSGSVARDLDPEGKRWLWARQFLEALREHPRAVNRVAMLVFGSSTQVVLEWTSPHSLPTDLDRQWRKLPAMGWSDLEGAFRMVEAISPSGCLDLVVITDGVPQTAERQDPSLHERSLEDLLRRWRRTTGRIWMVQIETPQARSWPAFQRATVFWQRLGHEGIVTFVTWGADPSTIARAIAEELGLPPTLVPSPSPSPASPAGSLHPPSTPWPPSGEVASPSPSPAGSFHPPSTGAAAPPGPQDRGWGFMGVAAAGLVFFLFLVLGGAHRHGRSAGILKGELTLVSGPNPVEGRTWDLSARRRVRIWVGGDLDPRLPPRLGILEARPGPAGPEAWWISSDGREFPLHDGAIWEAGPYRFRYQNLEARALSLSSRKGGRS